MFAELEFQKMFLTPTPEMTLLPCHVRGAWYVGVNVNFVA